MPRTRIADSETSKVFFCLAGDIYNRYFRTQEPPTNNSTISGTLPTFHQSWIPESQKQYRTESSGYDGNVFVTELFNCIEKWLTIYLDLFSVFYSPGEGPVPFVGYQFDRDMDNIDCLTGLQRRKYAFVCKRLRNVDGNGYPMALQLSPSMSYAT